MQQLLAITRNTFVETTRQPIYSVLLWVAAFWIGFVSPALAGFTLEVGNDKKVMIDVSLATLLLYGLLASVFSASSVITREIESHTVLTVVSKPVSRPLFLFGKYLGVTGAVLLGYYFLCLVLLMAARHGTMETAAEKFDQPVLVFGLSALAIALIVSAFGNYVYGWHFTSTLMAWAVPLVTLALVLVLFIDPQWKAQSPSKDFGDFQLIYAQISVFCGVLILTAFAVALATRFSLIVTLMFCAAIFLLGLLSDYYFGGPALEGRGPLYSLLYAAVPNFQYFWLGDPITQQLTIPGRQVAAVAGYASLYALAVLALGVSLFQTREVG
ncbi:MAG: ABC transporter permease subunit [Phycisphaerae bacterium]|nr:ABC transporter permease subunit [Phycisphaerae bacterium]